MDDPPQVEVVSEGFNGSTPTTILRSLTAVKVRAAEIAVVSGDLVVPIELSGCVYNDDRNGGAGTSGTDPIVLVTADWSRSLKSGTKYYANVGSLNAMNDSDLDYPAAMGRWASIPCRRYTGTDKWTEDVIAFALNTETNFRFGISLVEVMIRDSSSHEEIRTVTTPTMVDRDSNGYGPASSYPLWQVAFDVWIGGIAILSLPGKHTDFLRSIPT